MRKLILAMFVSADGYIEGPNGELAPPAWSDDLDTHWSKANLDRAGAVLYGRVCYEMMSSYWQSPAADAQVAKRLADSPKYLCSTTLSKVNWTNTSIIRGDIPAEIAALKTQPGKDVVCFGGAGIASSLLKWQLVDDMRLMVTPSLLGGGKLLFNGNYPRSALRLISARPMDTGAVILHYAFNRPQ